MSADFDQARLERWLTTKIPDFSELLAFEKFPGGQSNPTYRLTTPGASYVLRRKPFGPLLPSAHAVDREYRLLTALHPTGFPVPRPILLCEDDDVIGAIFYVMELVDGRTLWPGPLPHETPQVRGETYRAMIETLAQLHAIDHEAIGLSDYGRGGNYFERQIARWTKQYRASQTDEILEIERLIEWLPNTLPEQSGNAIIHGDYRLDNLIFAPDKASVAAVIDWELATIGDPLADLAYLMMNWIMPIDGRAGLLGTDFRASGIPTIEEGIAIYCRAAGREAVPDLTWYFAFNLFRLTAIVQGVKRRMMDGNASSAQAERAVAQLPALALAAWEQAKRAGTR